MPPFELVYIVAVFSVALAIGLVRRRAFKRDVSREISESVFPLRSELAFWGVTGFDVDWSLKSTRVSVTFVSGGVSNGVTVEGATSRGEALAEAARTLFERRMAWLREDPEFEGAGSREGDGAPRRERWREVLGVGDDADEKEVESAWRRLARRHHPDAGGNPADMAEINAAHDVAREHFARFAV